jgi:protein-S-isoprenylcysteine O-methyltransferase Ste14
MLIAPLAAIALDGGLLVLALGGLAPLRAHTRALALLALWFIGYAALAVLRPVRTRDPVAARADHALVVLALFAVPLLAPPLSAWAERAGLAPLPGGAALRWAGVVLSALGFGVRILAMRRLGSRFSPLIEVQRDHRLETDGIYARIRHPGYLGAWLSTLGAVVAFGSAATLALLVPLTLAFEARMRREERELERAFGEPWRDYRDRTGRFLPRLGAAKAASPPRA